jgi:drug/metabolite transporter (DMT)-like permease
MTRTGGPPTARANPPLVWVALGAVYIVWGTTYFAIRIVNQTMPPLLSASIRFLVAGTVMFAWTIRRGDRDGDRPGPRQWRAAAIVGCALLLGGNGGVVWAERTVPSGIVALIIALVPLWMALVDRVLLKHRLGVATLVGLTTGFAGAALLVGSSASGGGVDLEGMLFALGASLSWASGSLYSRHAPLPRRPFVGVGMEMLCGGVALVIVAMLAGELGDIHPERFSTASLLALGYLIVFGSFAGLGSYLWLLRNARTSLVSTYAYVNPVVAVFLGWAFLSEPIGVRTVVAGVIVLGSVALIIASGEATPAPEAASGGDLTEEGRAGVEGELALEGVGHPEQEGLPKDRRRDLEPDG